MKAATMLGGLVIAMALAVFPAASFAHEGEPANPAKAIARAMRHPLVIRGETAAHLVIKHVTRGCHVWSSGTRTARGARVSLPRGGTLTVRSQDIDMHRLVRLSGPRTPLGGYVRMNHQTTITFRRPGVYRLRTRTREMPGMPDVRTVGPDNPLPLVVTVR